MKSILVRYGELTLKGNNRNYFITKLIQNIKFKLKHLKEFLEYHKDNNSLTINVSSEKIEEVSQILTTIFGIYSISIVEIVEKDISKILNSTLEIAQQAPKGSFKIEVERKDKGFNVASVELKTKIAGNILSKTTHLTVDVHTPKTKINVVVKSDGVYIFTSKIKAARGLPVGVSGKCLSLLSGGIDSPVASYLAMKRGLQVDFLHFITPPHTSEAALQKVLSLACELEKYNQSNFVVYICDFSLLLRELMHIKEESYRITIMRRLFMRIANKLSYKIKAKALITGENLGQVASQTIESINVINEVSKLPILRPLITYDKEEIIAVAQQIKTYETSILPYDDVCSLYVPKNPITKPRSFVAIEQEKDALFEELVEHTMSNCIKKYIYKEGELVEKVETENSETK